MITTTAPRATPRCPQRSRNACITSPSRVPPDQSGTASPAAATAASPSRTRIARVTRVSRVPIVKTSVRARLTDVSVCAHRRRLSAYGPIDPDTSTSTTTRRVHVVRARNSSVDGSPPFRSCCRSVRRASTAPRVEGRRRADTRSGGCGRRVAKSRASRARSARLNSATSRCRSTSVLLAAARTSISGASSSPAPPDPSSSGA